METEPHLEALTQHVAGSLAVPSASAAAGVKVLMDSGSGTTAISEELVEALQGQPKMTQTALRQAFVGHARVVTSLGQECDIETQLCSLHLTIETPWGPLRFTMSFIVLPGAGDVVIIGQKTLSQRLGIAEFGPAHTSSRFFKDLASAGNRRRAHAVPLSHQMDAMSLLELAELEAPLRGLLEECLCNTRRTKRVAARRVIGSSEGTDERAAAWDAVRLRVSEVVPLNQLKPGFSVMMFPDASDNFWGSCITQVPTVESTGSVAIVDMSHEPLGFLSGPFRGSQERWATVDTEGFAIVSTFKRLPYLLWGGVAIHCDHRNLAYIFGANGAPTSRAVAQLLQGWRVFLGQFLYTIVHIPGDENCWGNLLWRWVTRPGGPVCMHASVKYAEVLFAGSDKFPTKEVVRDVQAAAAGNGPTLDTALGVASIDSEGVYRVEYHDHRVIWVPTEAESLKKRLLVCAHLEGAGHRGVDTTMARLERHCVREGMPGDVRDLIRLCLYCADTKAGGGTSAPYAGRYPSWARDELSCAFRFSLHGEERGGCRR